MEGGEGTLIFLGKNRKEREQPPKWVQFHY
jgi:hypothetical protein